MGKDVSGIGEPYAQLVGYCYMPVSYTHLDVYKRQVEWYESPLYGWYDRVYMSKVFDTTYSPDVLEPVNAKEVVKGGTGYSLSSKLPECIEHVYPDYSLYPALTKNTAYGYLTRGCPRACNFCIVSQKEGRKSRRVADLKEFWRGQKNIKLLDPNLLACNCLLYTSRCV